MAQVLEEVCVKDLVLGPKHLSYVELDDSLETALGRLAEENILALPVREQGPPRRGEDGGQAPPEIKFCGMLTALDVAAFVAREPEACGESGADVSVAQALHKTAESWHMLVLDPHATVAQAMEFLGVRGFHRALVPNVCLSAHSAEAVPLPLALVEEMAPSARGEDYRVLAQMDIARFIQAHEGRFGLALSQTLESVGLEGGRVLATTEGEKLSAALDRMASHSVSALAVVDKLEPKSPWAVADAALLDTLSASDLRGCTVKELKGASSTTVGEFLYQKKGTGTRKVLSCSKSSDLRSVLKQLLDHSVHRLWVVPEEYPGKPGSAPPVHGVVTLSDVIRIMRVLPITNEEPPQVGEGFRDAIEELMWTEWL